MRLPAANAIAAVLTLSFVSPAFADGRNVSQQPTPAPFVIVAPASQITTAKPQPFTVQVNDCPSCPTTPPTKACCEPQQYGSCIVQKGVCTCSCFSLTKSQSTQEAVSRILKEAFGKRINLSETESFDLVRTAFKNTAAGKEFVTDIPGLGEDVSISLSAPAEKTEELRSLGLYNPSLLKFQKNLLALPNDDKKFIKPPV